VTNTTLRMLCLLQSYGQTVKTEACVCFIYADYLK